MWHLAGAPYPNSTSTTSKSGPGTNASGSMTIRSILTVTQNTTTAHPSSSSTTVTCSGTTTFNLQAPIVTSTVTSFITVTLEPSQVFYPTWTNPVPFCVTVTISTLAASEVPSTSAFVSATTVVEAATETVLATKKQVVTVIVQSTPPNFTPTPNPAPVQSPALPPAQSSSTAAATAQTTLTTIPQTVIPAATINVNPVIITLGSATITIPAVVSQTTTVISGVTVTLNPTQVIASGSTITIPGPASTKPVPSLFTGGAAGLRRSVGAAELGAW